MTDKELIFNLKKELGEARTRNRLLNQSYIDEQNRIEGILRRIDLVSNENSELLIENRELTSKINLLKTHWLCRILLKKM